MERKRIVALLVDHYDKKMSHFQKSKSGLGGDCEHSYLTAMMDAVDLVNGELQ